MTDQASPTKMFEQVYDRITSDLVNEWRKEGVPEEAITRYKKSLDYNLLGGKMYRGVTVVNTAQILKRHPLSEDEYLKAAVLGWCVELGHAHGLVTDDIMDESMTRRFRPCWYRNLGIGLTAISDSAIGFWSIHRLLRLYFRKDPYYVDLLELFLESRWQTEIGQLIDLITALKETNTSTFSLERHSTLVVWKTAFYSFYLPVACAMYLCGITHTPVAPLDPSKSAEDPYEVAKSILLLLGEYFQVQDDYLDFAGTPAQIGKIGTDIIDKKCSWCINIALLHATPAQRKMLIEHYGKKPSGGPSELMVRAIFEEIGLREKYAEYEENIVRKLRGRIAEVPESEQENTLRREVFESLLDKIYKRNK